MHSNKLSVISHIQPEESLVACRASSACDVFFFCWSVVPGSHVMQYGALDMDKEVAGDYEGMLHNGSIPPSPIPSAEWLDFQAQHQWQYQQQQYKQYNSRHLLAAPSSTQQQRIRDVMSQHGDKLKRQSQKKTVLQRDADLLPLLHTAQHSHCPRKRSAAAQALHRETAVRQFIDATARSAVQQLLRSPHTGYVLMLQVSRAVLPKAQLREVQDSKSAGMLGSSGSSNGLVTSVSSSSAELLLGYLPGRDGRPLVDDWGCLRNMVQVSNPSTGTQRRPFTQLCVVCL